MANVGAEDALKAMLILALAHETGELVLENLPLVRVVWSIHVGDTVIRDIEIQRPTCE